MAVDIVIDIYGREMETDSFSYPVWTQRVLILYYDGGRMMAVGSRHAIIAALGESMICDGGY